MKKKFAVILCLALTVASVAGCGAKETPQAEPETKVEETKVEPAPVEEKVEEPKEEAKEEPAPSEATEAESTEPAKETEEVSEEPETEEASYIIDKYIEDNDFTDYADYGAEIGARVPKSKNNWNIYFLFNDDGYFVTVGTNAQDAEYSYVAIGKDQVNTWACLVRYIDVPTMPVFDDGSFVPVETAHMLEDTINYMKDHPDPNEKPDIPGMDFQSWAELIGN